MGSPKPFRNLTFVLTAGLGLACTESPRPSNEAATQAPAKEASGSKSHADAEQAPKAKKKKAGTVALHAHMHEHFVRLDRLQKAVVRGDLEGARDEARWLADHEAHSDLPEGWEPHIAAMRDAARAMVDSSKGEASQAAAQVADSCGGCHAANEATVQLGFAEFPTTEPDKALHQIQWVADRLWDAVVSGSDELWGQGVEGLEAISQELKDDPKAAKAFDPAAKTLTSVLADAKTAKERKDRVKVLGNQLQACVAMHGAR